ncbi:MAG: tetratricopeptide repeat protein [Proteobacteria bacterium]|nr:tetratricopeptide repeat protein [Pseudomonadota bacterium]
MGLRAVIVIVAAVLLPACGNPPAEPTPELAAEPAVEAWSPPEFRGRPWADELGSTDTTIERAEAKADASATDWLSLQTAAGALLSRARLTGSYDDYARAEAVVGRAFERAPEGSGPIATRASLNYSLHRLDRVAPDLDRMEALPPAIRVRPYDLALRRGSLAMELGDYEAARALLQESVDGKRTLPSLSTLALWFWKTGDFEVAEELYREAFAVYHGRNSQPVAWLHLQLGLLDLDRGRWDEAMEHYTAAGEVFPGWYLVDEHVAEILTLTGRTDEAIAIYERVIESTGNPEFMDAMAGIEAERGNDEASAAWIARGDEAYGLQLAAFPEAAYGHALGHYLEFGDPAVAVEMATKNHAIRPNGQARVWLAEALLAADRAPDGVAVVEEALAGPYRSSDLHVAASGCYGAMGDKTRADEHRALALAINPHAFD